MTAEPSSPEPDARDASRPKARRFLRLLVWGLTTIGVLVFALWLVLQSGWARELVRSRVVAAASEALGREVTIEELDFGLVPPEVDLSGITVAGAAESDVPLATVRQLSVRAGTGLVVGLLRDRPLTLAEIVVTEPEVAIVFFEDGSSNLPELPAGEEDEAGGLEVRIEALHLTDGLLRLEEQSLPLDFSAEGLQASLREVGERELLLRADGELLRVGLAEGGLTASASVQALVADGGIELQHARLRSSSLNAEADGHYRDEVLELGLTGSVDLALLEELGLDEAPEGSVSIEGSLSADGEIWSAQALATAPELVLAGTTIEEIVVSLDASAAALEVEIDSAGIAEGRVSGLVTVPLGDDPGPIVLDLAVADLDLATVLSTVDAPVVGLQGSLDADVDYRFDPDAPMLGSGGAEVRVTPPPAVEGLESWAMPLDGVIPVVVEGGVLRVEEASVTAPGQQILAGGEVVFETGRADFDFRLETEDPRAVLRLLPVIYETDDSPLWEPSRGLGTLEGSLTVEAPGFETRLELDLRSAVLTGYPVPGVEGSLVIDSGGIQDLDLLLRRDEASIAVWVTVPFDDAPPGYETPEFGVGLEIDRWEIGYAEPWLDLELPFSGLATGELEIGGEPETPSGALQARVSDLSVGEFEIPGEISGRIEFDPERVAVGPLRLVAPAGDLELVGTLDPPTGRLDLRLASSPLELAAPPFDDWVAGYLAGTAEIEAELTGTLEDPVLRAGLTGSGLALQSRALGDGGESRLDVSWAGGTLDVSGSLLGLVETAGGGALSETETDIEIRLASEAVREILELLLGQAPEEMVGSFDGAVIARVNESSSLFEVRVEDLDLASEQSHLANIEPVVLSFGEDGARLESFYLAEEGTGSEVFVTGDLRSSEGEMDLRIVSSIDAGWLSLYLPDLDLSGHLDLLAVVRGTPEFPRLDGQAEMSDGRLIIAGFPHAIEDLHGFAFLYPDRVVIDSGRASLAGGELLAEGEIGLGQEDDLEYELRFSGNDLDIRYPEDWRIRGDGRLVLSQTPSGRVLSGTVELESAAFVKELQLGFSQLARTMLQRRPEIVEETDEVLVGTRLNIAVDGPDALHIQTGIADLRGDLDFTVRGNLAAPVLLGEINLARGGQINLSGTEYVLDRGALTFSSPFRNDPQVDLVATANIQAYDVQLSVFGPADDLQTSLSSNPPLSSLDIVSLMATGSVDLLGSVGSDVATGEGSGSAEAFLAGQAASLAGQRVGSFIGLDQVQISPLTGGSADLSAARVTVGRRISRDVFVTYSYDPSESEEGIFELKWQIYPSISLILTRSDDGSVAADMRWDKAF